MPVVVIPCTKYLCKLKNKIKQGIRDKTDIANIEPHEEMPVESRKRRSPKGTVYNSGEFRNIIWLKKSSHVHRNLKSKVVIIAGMLKGRIILK